MKYQVRTKKYEGRRWKVVAEFDTSREAKRFAIGEERRARHSLDTRYDSWDVKNTVTGERFIVA